MKNKVKICINEGYSFYDAYHEERYIVSHDCSSPIVCKDKGQSREYRFVNNDKKEVIKYCIDGGIISEHEISKCDFGIFTEDNQLYLIELKGGDYKHAIEQIDTTIQTLIENRNIKVDRIDARVVLSKVRNPNILTTKEKKLKSKLSRYKGTLKKCTRKMEEQYCSGR